MALSSVVAVADNLGFDTSGITVQFVPGDPYPVVGQGTLTITDGPFLRSPPTSDVPTVTSVAVTFGAVADDAGQQPPPFVPAEHSLRELSFDASYVEGSWDGAGKAPSLRVAVAAGLRDNSPSGDSPPDDPFRCTIQVRAICIWTQEAPTVLDQLVRDVRRVIPL
jgi:hypothetical protein